MTTIRKVATTVTLRRVDMHRGEGTRSQQDEENQELTVKRGKLVNQGTASVQERITTGWTSRKEGLDNRQ